jgi:hypothetical protein
MLCHNFLIGKGHTCALRTTCTRVRFQLDRMSAARMSTTIILASMSARAPAPASPPLGRSQWSSAPAGSTGGRRPGWALARLPSERRASHGRGHGPLCCCDTSTCLQDKRDEVILVGVLRRFGRGVGLRRQSRCCTTAALVDMALGPGAHHADVEDPRAYVRTMVPWWYVYV